MRRFFVIPPKGISFWTERMIECEKRVLIRYKDFINSLRAVESRGRISLPRLVSLAEKDLLYLSDHVGLGTEAWASSTPFVKRPSS